MMEMKQKHCDNNNNNTYETTHRHAHTHAQVSKYVLEEFADKVYLNLHTEFHQWQVQRKINCMLIEVASRATTMQTMECVSIYSRDSCNKHSHSRRTMKAITINIGHNGQWSGIFLMWSLLKAPMEIPVFDHITRYFSDKCIHGILNFTIQSKLTPISSRCHLRFQWPIPIDRIVCTAPGSIFVDAPVEEKEAEKFENFFDEFGIKFKNLRVSEEKALVNLVKLRVDRKKMTGESVKIDKIHEN